MQAKKASNINKIKILNDYIILDSFLIIKQKATKNNFSGFLLNENK